MVKNVEVMNDEFVGGAERWDYKEPLSKNIPDYFDFPPGNLLISALQLTPLIQASSIELFPNTDG